MYVCICQAVTDTAIRKAVAAGATSLSDLSFRTGCATQCGSCREAALELLEEAQAEGRESAAPGFLQLVSSAA